VFVIDSKNWSGDVRVVDGVLRQDGRRREREVAAAAEAALAVTQLLEGLAATAVLCFLRDEPLDARMHDVLICSTGSLVATIVGQPQMFDPESVSRMTTILAGQLSPARANGTGTRPSGEAGSDAYAAIGKRSPSARPRKRSSASLRRTERLTLVKGFVIAVALAVGAVVALPKIAAHTPELLGLQPVHAQLGRSVELHGSSSRPTMQLTAESLRVLPRDRARQALKPGERLVAVHLHVSNESAMTWTSPGLIVTARDSVGEVLKPVGIRRTKHKAPMPAVIRFGPGGDVDGYVAFALPRAARLTELSLTVGPKAYETVRWTIPR
jgi:hypothetical protein